MDLDTLLGDKLGQMRAQGLFRDPEDVAARERVAEAARSQALTLIDATCNDYLGLGRQQVRLVEDFEGAAPPMGLPPSEDQRSDVSRETFRAGSGAARLVQGTWPIHLALEAALADWVGLPAALLFNSGYAANSGAIPALAGSDSVVLSDRLNHASIVDGCRLSKARVEVLPHLDLDALEAALKGASACATRWVVTESYFSMDGDGPDLLSLRRLCDRHAAYLYVDEAHSLGVYGREGAGRCAEAGVRPDILVGTLGKAVGTEGAFVAGSQALRAYLWNRARTFVFSTAPSPAISAQTLAHVKRLRKAPSLQVAVLERAHEFREALKGRALRTPPGSFGPVVAVLVGAAVSALAAAELLRKQGILTQAIRPPTVPEGSSRLRITISASMSSKDVLRLADALAAALEQTCAASS